MLTLMIIGFVAIGIAIATLLVILTVTRTEKRHRKKASRTG
jgi:uncharacterized phage infection (PIP) family protein YhgE